MSRSEDGVEFAAASLLERVALGALVKRQRAARIFEIGTFRGVTALAMASNAPEGSVLYTLDLPPDLSVGAVASHYYSNSPGSGFHQMATAGAARNVGLAFRGYRGPCRIVQLFGDSAEMDFQEYEDSIDLFFVDGCHEYDAARRDTLTAWSCLRHGGVIVWHDYLWASVQDAARDARLSAEITSVQGTSIAFARRP
jgi:predicted O-methyltransferase YrrM